MTPCKDAYLIAGLAVAVAIPRYTDGLNFQLDVGDLSETTN